MIDFIDKTTEQSGTPINRETLMALQGFIANNTVFNADGSIIETNSKGETLTTVFNNDGSITETFVGEKTITKTTKFIENAIVEEILQ
jgi:exosome complex RNA-binding protein Rrp42 (RNase PH superfamily)